MHYLFTDGGIIGKNPSSIGGTWAYVLLENGKPIGKGSGILTPEDIGCSFVTNNVTELYALAMGVLSVPSGSSVNVYSDSQISLCRMFNRNPKMNGVPDWVEEEAIRAREHLKTLDHAYSLLKGHPTKAQLKAGFGKSGSFVSIWNVYCDKQCSRLAKAFQVQQKQEEDTGKQATPTA